MIDALWIWIRAHEVLLGWLSAASALMFIGSVSLIPWLVVRIPADYFVHRTHYVDRWRPRHPLLRAAVLVLKNAAGVVLVLAGVAMLVLPGQGILTIAVGLIVVDFPGKFALERRLVQHRSVLGAMNWIRAKAHRPPLESPEGDCS